MKGRLKTTERKHHGNLETERKSLYFPATERSRRSTSRKTQHQKRYLQPARRRRSRPARAAQVRQWLEQAGIAAFRHQPVTAPAITDADIDTFHKLLAELPPPVLAYCRTGTRCSLLWGYRQIQNGSSVAEVKTASARAGVDLTNFEARLQAAADNR